MSIEKGSMMNVMASASASPSLRIQYKEQGYVIVRKLIPENVTNRVLADLDLAATQVLQLRRGQRRDLTGASLLEKLRAVYELDLGLYLSILRMGSRLQSVYALAMHDNILGLLGDLGCRISTLPCGVAIHLVSNELKVPGGYFGWGAHQDWSSAQGSLDQFVLWTPLMDVDKHFHPIEIVPGSHKMGVLPGDRKSANSRGALIPISPDHIDERDFTCVELQRGDAIIFSGLLVHRTGSGTRDGLRIACGSRFDNVQEPTFVERGYPCAFRLHAETDVLHPGFPTGDHIRQLFE